MRFNVQAAGLGISYSAASLQIEKLLDIAANSFLLFMQISNTIIRGAGAAVKRGPGPEEGNCCVV